MVWRGECTAKTAHYFRNLLCDHPWSPPISVQYDRQERCGCPGLHLADTGTPFPVITTEQMWAQPSQATARKALPLPFRRHRWMTCLWPRVPNCGPAQHTKNTINECRLQEVTVVWQEEWTHMV